MVTLAPPSQLRTRAAAVESLAQEIRMMECVGVQATLSNPQRQAVFVPSPVASKAAPTLERLDQNQD